ncbi:pyridoxamine 5'-phosphate oxidase family protein [Paenibacillus donghaensis]|uniref:pyridoxamine 5'-phosphate oxidase family protein n=1 Tax=Paenibacillus donghaensis TaxID=414771 RepID=UPI0018843C5A|nr:pyridoxamine 5'-phosphate oxidase family protein [Paenibacillus donghaensis]MBE9915875.1 pyridoxamine 5'-phosphate oxidase family protein [Paenibacillus donghaensis]
MEARILMEQNIVKILDHHEYCAFATVEGNKPKQRYMMLYNRGLSVYLITDRKTHKVAELQANPHVSLLFGYENGCAKGSAEIEGTCTITDERELREYLWKPEFKDKFTGPEDPDYVILKINPVRIVYVSENGEKHEWIE